MMQLVARIRLKTPQEAGINRDAGTGMALSFSPNGDLIACYIKGLNGQTTFLRGTDYDVQIDLPDGAIYADSIAPGITFDIHIGSRVFGQGEVLEIIED